ncbi:hypothetical protein [Methylobacterium oxalidis]|uniref:hypothetical protein n=1 Tax=Methylobacterium oxalidis TaxID=944322 RepID=UPI003315CFD0
MPEFIIAEIMLGAIQPNRSAHPSDIYPAAFKSHDNVFDISADPLQYPSITARIDKLLPFSAHQGRFVP